MIKQFGINLPPNVDPKLKNVAAVTVTAEIPPSYSPGRPWISPSPRWAMPRACAAANCC